MLISLKSYFFYAATVKSLFPNFTETQCTGQIKKIVNDDIYKKTRKTKRKKEGSESQKSVDETQTKEIKAEWTYPEQTNW